MSSPFETAPTNNKTIRAHRLSISRLMCNHFHWKCLITSLLISICVAHVAYCQLKGWQNDGNRTTSTHLSSSAHSSASNLCSNGYISVISVVLGATFYFIYLSECWHHYAQLGLLPRYSVGQVLELVETMRDAIPVVWWKSVCYHYVRRSRRVMRYRNGDAISTTQVYYERVNSNSSGNVFLYDECGYKDLSKSLLDLNQFSAIRMRFSKGFVFACLQAANEFEDQRTRFFAENEMRDDYMEVREGLDLANLPFVERLLVFPERKKRNVPKPTNNVAQNDTSDDSNNVQLQLPWWLCPWVYWLTSLVLCSWPLRLVAECQTARVHFQVTKLFGTNYLSPSSVNYTGALTRTSTMESHELEEANRRNYLIVPSYSEAILLDPMEQNREFLQPANLFRQILSYPWRHVTPTVPGNDTAVHSTYGAVVDHQHRNFRIQKNGGEATAANALAMTRSQSISFFSEGTDNFCTTNNRRRPQPNHLPCRTRTAFCRQHYQPPPPRSITISEGIDAVQSTQFGPSKATANGANMIDALRAVPKRSQQQRVGTDREPLLEFVRTDLDQLEMHNFTFQQMPAPDEPPPPYELALRYCSPLYQRLRHSVQSLSSALFQHSNSTRDLRQYAMDGPGSSSRQC